MKDFSDIKPNLLAYGGNAGNKKGFTNEKGENWFLKFPQNAKYFEKVHISYTTSPISEYLGSKIYELLGYDVHKTELGIYNDKIVVACKDFIDANERFCDIASITNNYLDENEDIRQNLKSSSEEKYFVDLEELIYVFKLHKIPDLNERFWDMFVVDAFINNSDRHNGNWGVLVDLKNNEVKLAPIFDNGNSFFSKHDDSKLEKILQNETSFQSNVLRGKTPFKYLEHSVDAVKVIKNLAIGKEKNEFTDEIVRTFGDWKNEADQVKAGRMAIKLRKDCIEKGLSFNQETTLTGNSIIKLVDKVKEKGYKVHLFYVGLNSPEIAKERIAGRVKKGGHNIPSETVEKRYYESIENLKIILPKVDLAEIYDNSKFYTLAVVKSEGVIKSQIKDLPEWLKNIAKELK